MAVTKMNPTLGKLASKAHAGLYSLSGGRIGGSIGDAETLILTAPGRKSGEPRKAPLFFVEHGAGWAVAASNSGHDFHPAWYLNLMAAGHATVQIGQHEIVVKPRVVEGEERQELWGRLVAVYQGYDEYRKVTDRVIPVVVLSSIESVDRADESAA